jgi:hypothetical protein
MPSGASGVNYSLDYLHTGKLKSNNNVVFGCIAELDFSNFDTWQNFDYFFYDNGLNTSVFWLVHLPVRSENISLYAGCGLSFDANVYYSYNSNELSFGYGQWFLSPNIYVSGDYTFKKIIFQLRCSMPLLSAGFQSRTLFYSTLGENLKLVLTPNTFSFFTKRFYPQADLSCSYPIINTKNGECRLQLKYALDELFFNGFPSERKEVHELKLGILWMIND